MKITVYSTTTCTFCVQLEKWLTSKELPYTKFMLDQDEELKNKVIEESGFRSVPITLIEKDDNSKEYIMGFDVPKLSATLGV